MKINEKKNFNTSLRNNVITVYNLKKELLIFEFINTVKRLVFKFKHKEIIIDLNSIDKIFTYPTLPICGIIQYFKNVYNITFKIINDKHKIANKGLLTPYIVNEQTERKVEQYLHKIWEFKNTDDITIIHKGIMNNLRTQTRMETGVMNACEWSMYEIMDNVLTHSKTDRGFIFTQLILNTNELQVCIYDYGIGIYRTIRSNDYHPKSHVDAISIALQKGKKGGSSEGQGNGMWGLSKIIFENKGYLFVESGKGSIKIKEGGNRKVKNIIDLTSLSFNNNTTMVYYDIKLNNKLNITETLEISSYTDLYTESFEDEKDNMIFKIAEKKAGFGTRLAGKELRNELLNLIKVSGKPVTIDFEEVNLMTSSFADEFIAKLLEETGLYQFQKSIKLKNLNHENQLILNKAIQERYYLSYKEQEKQ